MYLIPKPQRLEKKEGVFTFDYETYLSVDPGCSFLVTRQAGLFNERVKEVLGYCPTFVRGSAQKGDIVFVQDDTMEKQSYVLDITEDSVVLTGEEAGLWHGMQTLLQIIEQEGGLLCALHIEDRPAIANRGYYFDCTRGRIPKLEWLKKLADRMAYYKLNQLQLYIEHTYLFRGMTELWRDDTPLTAAEIMELDHYCSERGIELVPSLSSFGHLYKLLCTKEYAHLCELEGSATEPFSLDGRMHHHMINPVDPESLVLIKGMIKEYMELFSSRKFNLCADETFDLGRGKSREAVEKYGRDTVYINYVKEVANFLIENGRRPMFWGDIILGFPEMVKELPEEMICLNWGYAWDQDEEPTKKMYEAGATQYCCPGCSSWNRFVPRNMDAYNNISRLCSYAVKYGAEGVLNTDWGDFLHVSQPDLSRAGMIYGAAFSWNADIPSCEEINRQISRVEYHDRSEKLLSILARVQENTAFHWYFACLFVQKNQGVGGFEQRYANETRDMLIEMEEVETKNNRLYQIKKELYGQIAQMDNDRKNLVKECLVGVDGLILTNELGKVVAAQEHGKTYENMPDCRALAKRIETWLYHYKELYRAVSKEGELRRIEEIFGWYGDYLRTRR